MVTGCGRTPHWVRTLCNVFINICHATAAAPARLGPRVHTVTMGNGYETHQRPIRPSSRYRQYYPSMIVVLLVLAFWTVAILGGLGLLRSGRAPLETLTWLYAVLALIVGSSVALCLAVVDIYRRIRRELREYRQLGSHRAAADR